MTGQNIVTCHQPTYLPWAGLFHKLALSDHFVVMDNVQYSPRNWLNRNRIKGPQGVFWLSVPVSLRTSASRRLTDIMIDSAEDSGAGDWQRSHWRSLCAAYSRAPYWGAYSDALEHFYLGHTWTRLAELNLGLLRHLVDVFGLRTRFVLGSELEAQGAKSDLVLDMCLRTSATAYIAGMNGHDYLVERDFLAAGVSVVYQRYHAPTYPQRFAGFDAELSVLDLLFNVGERSRTLLLSGNVTKGDLRRALDGGPTAVLESCRVAGRAQLLTRPATDHGDRYAERLVTAAEAPAP